MGKPKIAIIGAGLAGLSCALECERLGVHPNIFERDSDPGWLWPSVTIWLELLYREMGDIIHYISDQYNIGLNYRNILTSIIMKSPSKLIKIENENLGYYFERGKRMDSIENQLIRALSFSSLNFNHVGDYKKLSKEYDYVLVATGGISEVKDLGVWEELDKVYIYEGIAVGSFNCNSSTIYFNTDYAGTGYARITPFNPTKAIIGLYVIGKRNVEMDLSLLFERFIKQENLKHLDFVYKLSLPVMSIGRVKKFKVGNVLLAGTSAGLTDRFLGIGGYNAMFSGIMAARSMIQNKNYNTLMKPIKKRVENISAIRDEINKLNNNDFDKILTVLDMPVIKKTIYDSKINFTKIVGSVLKKFKSSN